MSLYAVWPCVACVALLLGLAATPLLRTADAPNTPTRRLAAIDGLRGFLALGVFFHHAAITHRVLIDGQWTLPPRQFYVMVGQGGVAMFFMITGYLFWSRLLGTAGRPDWLDLYVGRVFRIGPLYLAACAAAIALALHRTGMVLHVSPGTLARQIGPWLALGLLPLPPVNLYPQTDQLLAGVTWTLHYEWLFYAALLPLSLFARLARLVLAAPVAGLLACLAWAASQPASLGPILAALFLTGMTSASLRHAGIGPTLPAWTRSTAVAALIAAAFLCPTAYAPPAVLLLGLAFHLIAGGADLFGLLTSRSARRLGSASYGIYLLQGPVLTVVFNQPRLRALALGSGAGHWAVTALSAAVLVLLAGVAHAVIERPGVRLGRRVAATIRGPRRRPSPPAGRHEVDATTPPVGTIAAS